MVFKKIKKSIKSFLGVGAEGSGGSRDAYGQFNQMMGRLEPYMQASRRRLDGNRNEFIGAIGGAFGDLSSNLEGFNGSVQGALRSSALANSLSAQKGAIGVARQTASRGGLAFGGGASALSAAAGRDAQVQQNAMLSNALAQGTMADLQFDMQRRSGMDQFALARAGGMQQGQLASAGFRDAELERSLQFDLSQSANMFNLGSGTVMTGLQGDQARQNRKSGMAQFGLETGLKAFGVGGFGR